MDVGLLPAEEAHFFGFRQRPFWICAQGSLWSIQSHNREVRYYLMG